ncbi:MAG: glycosyltransferase family 4 protein [Candidatus Jorgensenbacteria bacterium]
MRILIATDSYPPEVRSAAQLMQELAEGLHACDHEVTVATTVPAYNLADGTNVKNVPRDETMNGVRVVRIATLPHHRIPYIFRGINQLLLPCIFARAVQKTLPGPFDEIIVHSPPLPLALAAAKLAKYYHAKFIANIHDIFPQNGIDLVAAWQKPLIRLVFGPMERRVYRSTDLIVVPSENHARYLEGKRGVPAQKLRVIPHWIDTKPFDAVSPGNRFRKQWGLENTFVFFFGGVLGPSQGLDMVLAVAEAFQSPPTLKKSKDAKTYSPIRANWRIENAGNINNLDNSNNSNNVKFLFVGDGTARSQLEQIVREKKLGNVIFKPFVSSGEYPALVKEMDVGVATLASKNTTPAVPAKLMGYMAGGIPVVVAVHRESDAIRIVDEAKCGFTAISDDREAVVAVFRAAYEAFASPERAEVGRASLKTLGENGRRYLEKHFTKEKLVAEWDEMLRGV